MAGRAATVCLPCRRRGACACSPARSDGVARWPTRRPPKPMQKGRKNGIYFFWPFYNIITINFKFINYIFLKYFKSIPGASGPSRWHSDTSDRTKSDTKCSFILLII